MKLKLWTVVASGIFAVACWAQTSPDGGASASTVFGQTPPSGYQIVDCGRHYRVWQATVNETTPDGSIEARTHSYTELRSCMNYYQNGQWMESLPDFVITNGYAMASQCDHQVIVAPTLADPDGVVDLLTPDGQRMRSAILGLMLFEPSSGDSLQIGTVQNVVGQQTAPNEITFFNAFEGIKANVRFRNEAGGFHQDILLNEKLTAQQLVGLGFSDPTKVRLEIWTEFLRSPAPTITNRTLASEISPVLAARLMEPNALDEQIEFGTMSMAMGVAFLNGGGAQGAFKGSSSAVDDSAVNGVPVFKRWINSQGQNCLIESANYGDLQLLLESLPAAGTASLTPKRPSAALMAARAPPVRTKAARQPSVRIAALTQQSPRVTSPQVTLDYTLLSDGQALTNYTFLAQTYLVSGHVTLAGTTTLSGDAVVKFSSSATDPRLYLNGPLVCQTAPYRYAIFTTSDDNFYGDQIPGSSGTPTRLAGTCLWIQSTGAPFNCALSYARLAHFGTVVSGQDVLSLTVRDCQFIDSGTACASYAGPILAGNCLFSGCTYCFNASSALSAVNVTSDICTNFCHEGSGGPTNIVLTNCLIITQGALNNVGATPVLDHTYVFASAAGLFQSVGAANYYLPAGSPYHAAGNGNIDPRLLGAGNPKTTYAPIYLTNAVSGDTANKLQVTFAPAVARVAALQPDIGYCYDPIDYLADNWSATNASVTVQPGTVIAWCFHTAGLWLNDNSDISCQGTPLQPVLLTPYPSVQEQATWIGTNRNSMVPLNPTRTDSISGAGNLRFTDFNLLQGDYYSLYAGSGFLMTPLTVQDCAIRGGTVYLSTYSNQVVTVQNTLFQSVYFRATGVGSLSVYNSLFQNGRFAIARGGSASAWTATDNLYDSTTNSVSGGPTSDYNAFYNCTFTLYTTNAHDIILTNLAYASSPLGAYYQANTNLVNMGSRLASTAGLYHYTIQTNQVPETNSFVDIGLHYVALDPNCNPLDTNGDGIPDYLSDANGNGLVDSGEVGWNIAGDLGLNVIITRPANGAILP